VRHVGIKQREITLPKADPIEIVLWAILLILVIGYLIGTWLNRQHSKAVGSWLQEGIKSIGGKATWKWLRSISSGGQVTITGAQQPFSTMEVSFAFLTRELAPLWAVELFRGKRDLLVIRANLREKPAQAFEVLPLEGELRKTLDAHSTDQPWDWQVGPAGLGIATRGDPNKKRMAELRKFLDQYGGHLQRLSLRDRQPNLVLFLHLGGSKKQPPQRLFQALRRITRA
jgi:hypothetical protein